MRPPIVETMMSELVTEGRELLAAVVKSEQEAAWNRVVLGRFLAKARKQLPQRGTPTHGWGAFLEAMEMDPTTADRYMKLAEASLTLTERDKDKVPTYADLGIDRRESPQIPDAPPHTDDDAPVEIRDHGDPVGTGGAAAPELDHNGWCTPKELAEQLGEFDLDPCSNDRAHIVATRKCIRERGDDGLHGETGAYLIGGRVFHATKEDRVFINCPYERGAVQRWVRAYKHTRFTFLLRLDTSTDWFDELYASTALILIPKGERIEFEPPAGIEASKNPYPHGLFFARTKDAPKALMERCYVWRT